MDCGKTLVEQCGRMGIRTKGSWDECVETSLHPVRTDHRSVDE